jgi:hypothetical protein
MKAPRARRWRGIGIANYVRNTTGAPHEKSPRLPRRPFLGGLRHGEGRLYTKNAGNAFR